MAFSGYLLKVGDYTVPLSFMRYDTYQVGYHGQDLDSYRDANGELHRTALTHRVGKIEFNTPMMTQTQFQSVWANVKAKYTNEVEKRANVTWYDVENDTYHTQAMYVPDITPQIRNVDGNTINLNEVRIAFIAY